LEAVPAVALAKAGSTPARRSLGKGWFEVQISLLSHFLLLPASPF